jgi:Na+-driven multidrug efflux pump
LNELIHNSTGHSCPGGGYLSITGGAYVFLGLGLTLASSFQAAGRPLWPLVGITSRAITVLVGGWILVHLTNDIEQGSAKSLNYDWNCEAQNVRYGSPTDIQRPSA